ncbi:hypothetical protein Acr_20g0007100 [Actinidia rufa]|uniref:Uncharacterized protein n=1 Tax=Actinidia rufa TaxID=165716 RepID=A0A7J0GDT3_9ERIC|nr:hypothetical protein Acr_20g0007100 [Actinidia rufa]
MISHVQESSVTTESSSAPVALISHPDLSQSQHTPAQHMPVHHVTNCKSLTGDLGTLADYFGFPSVLLGGTDIILNTFPLPSLYEVFAIIDGYERRRHLILASPTISSGPSPISNQMAFAASSGLGSRSSGGRPIAPTMGDTGQ